MKTGTFTMVCRTPYNGALLLDATYDTEAEMWRVETRYADDAPMATFHEHPISGMMLSYEEWLAARRAASGYAEAKIAMYGTEPNDLLRDVPFKPADSEVLVFPGTPPRDPARVGNPSTPDQRDAKRVVTLNKTWIRNNPDLFQKAIDEFYAKAVADGMATRQMDDGGDYHLIAWDVSRSHGGLEL